MSNKSFPVSTRLRIDAVVGDTRPYLVIHQGNKPTYYIVLYLDEVRELMAQLAQATLYLQEDCDGI